MHTSERATAVFCVDGVHAEETVCADNATRRDFLMDGTGAGDIAVDYAYFS